MLDDGTEIDLSNEKRCVVTTVGEVSCGLHTYARHYQAVTDAGGSL